MVHEDLIQSVEVSAEERKREILERTRREVEEIKRDAERRAELIQKTHKENAVGAVEADRRKLISGAKEEIRMQAIKSKAEIFERAFEEAASRLAMVRSNSSYEGIFKTLLEEAIQELEGEEVEVHVDRKDEDLCKTILKGFNKNPLVIPDIHSAGGVMVSTKDGRQVVRNTIESRLERARELLRPDMFKVLYGD